ncbi:hypothetical protein BV25DRAFT_1820341 [Artomyces pyxidatus]|uniref:Uncharacterized protein n=1 Tax=Artomyces pyxidatus TaxID=48021 RepID=A0ACB8TDD6_9AGAM|nr:hypothetical protein BV25DRAFT_1820341 [Artomyces pyxidatus]
MEDAGEGTTTLKALLIDRPPSPALAATIGTVLGEFWGRLHSWGTSNPALLEFFTRWTYARTICAYITYGRLVDTLTGQSALPALDDPPLGVPAAKLHAIRELCALRTAQMEAARQTFVQGDFWPGNLLVRLAPGGGALERIFVVDWEVARPGLAGVEVGQFCAELATVRRFHPPSGEAAARVLETFLASYFGGLAQLDHAETARVALGHFGAHLVAWTPRVPWDGVEKTRAAVMDGVDFLVESYSGKESLSEGGLIDRFLR